jgi:hypothetical protein
MWPTAAWSPCRLTQSSGRKPGSALIGEAEDPLGDLVALDLRGAASWSGRSPSRSWPGAHRWSRPSPGSGSPGTRLPSASRRSPTCPEPPSGRSGRPNCEPSCAPSAGRRPGSMSRRGGATVRSENQSPFIPNGPWLRAYRRRILAAVRRSRRDDSSERRALSGQGSAARTCPRCG